MNSPEDVLTEIKKAFRNRTYRYTEHAVQQTTKRHITSRELEQAIGRGEIIEDYPHDKYGPSCLIFGLTEAGRPLHIQCSYPPVVKLITAYEPDPKEWIDYKVRRAKEGQQNG